MKRAEKEAGQAACPPACLALRLFSTPLASQALRLWRLKIFFSQLALAQAVTIFSQNLIAPGAVQPKRSEI
jgi:hypothetical protein